MSANDDRPLAALRVLLTKLGPRGSRLARVLIERGATVDVRPTARLAALDDPQTDAVVARLAEFDWVVFSSTAGVEFLERRVRSLGASLGERVRIAAVGSATADAVRERGWPEPHRPERAHGDGLARELIDRGSAGERVLVVRPLRSATPIASMLRRAGFAVEDPPFYDNLPADDVDETARRVVERAYDRAVITSPSSWSHLLAAIERRASAAGWPDSTGVVAFGPSTAETIEATGIRPVRMVDAGAEHLVAALSASPGTSG